MSQFDVYKNSNSRTNKSYPYLVDVQNPLIEEIATRIVIPLGTFKIFKQISMTRLTPEVIFMNEKFILLTPEIASISKNRLKNHVGSLSYARDEIIASIDFSITG